MNIITLIVIGALGAVLMSTITGVAVAIVRNIQQHHPEKMVKLSPIA